MPVARDVPTEPVRVDVWSDLVCPWCYLGKRRFEKALATFPDRDQVDDDELIAEVARTDTEPWKPLPHELVVEYVAVQAPVAGGVPGDRRHHQLHIQRLGAADPGGLPGRRPDPDLL